MRPLGKLLCRCFFLLPAMVLFVGFPVSYVTSLPMQGYCAKYSDGISSMGPGPHGVVACS